MTIEKFIVVRASSAGNELHVGVVGAENAPDVFDKLEDAREAMARGRDRLAEESAEAGRELESAGHGADCIVATSVAGTTKWRVKRVEVYVPDPWPYDYRKAVEADVRSAFEERGVTKRLDPGELDELYDELYDDDAVTGNGSGSYTFSTWGAEENLSHNSEILKEALDELGAAVNVLEDPEGCDVLIRCHLLYAAMVKVNKSLPEDGGDGKKKEEEDDED